MSVKFKNVSCTSWAKPSTLSQNLQSALNLFHDNGKLNTRKVEASLKLVEGVLETAALAILASLAHHVTENGSEHKEDQIGWGIAFIIAATVLTTLKDLFNSQQNKNAFI